MAGPRIMTLGPFQFEALGFSFQGRRRIRQTPWIEIETAGGANRLQWAGAKGETQTIRGALFSEYGGQASLEGIKLAASNGVPLPLIDLAGAPFNVFGLHVVETVDEDHDAIDRYGQPWRNGYAIHLRHYPGGLLGMASFSVLSLFS